MKQISGSLRRLSGEGEDGEGDLPLLSETESVAWHLRRFPPRQPRRLLPRGQSCRCCCCCSPTTEPPTAAELEAEPLAATRWRGLNCRTGGGLSSRRSGQRHSKERCPSLLQRIHLVGSLQDLWKWPSSRQLKHLPSIAASAGFWPSPLRPCLAA